MISRRRVFYGLVFLVITSGLIFYVNQYYESVSLYKTDLTLISQNINGLIKTNEVITDKSSSIEESIKLLDKVYIKDVPFLSQAPLADWKDERQQDGCEEASSIMASAWLNGESYLSKQEGLKRILLASEWFETNIGTFHDASVEDVVRFLKESLGFKKVDIIEEPSLDDYKLALNQSKLILVPTNGQLLGNPNFSGVGPERHMIVVRGYDDVSGEFITNDPGTRKGENYRYKYGVVLNANSAYPTGFHAKINQIRRAIIVVGH